VVSCHIFSLRRRQANRIPVHHCPMCKHPLTTPQARTRCLGEHVEWCGRYHTQLFKKGTSDQCAPCRACEEEHIKRHREIATKILELRQLKASQEPIPPSPLTPRALNALQSSFSPMSKEERKANTKANKILRAPKVVTQKDIEFIAKVLHPDEHCEVDEDDAARQITEDEDIKRNMFFHKNTSSTRETRNTFFTKVNRHRPGFVRPEYHVTVEEIDGLLQLLNVSPITKSTSTEEKTIITVLRKKIEDDLVQVHNEKEQTLMRKEGFWRWASKKAYKRFVDNGGVWSKRDGELLSMMKGEDASTEESSDAVGGAEETEDGSTEPDTDITTPSEEEDTNQGYVLSSPSTPVKLDIAVTTPKTVTSDSWSVVAGSKKGSSSRTKKAPPGLTLRLRHNHGLDHLKSPLSKRLDLFDDSWATRDPRTEYYNPRDHLLPGQYGQYDEDSD